MLKTLWKFLKVQFTLHVVVVLENFFQNISNLDLEEITLYALYYLSRFCNKFANLLVRLGTYIYAPRFYIPSLNYLASNIELFIFFYLLYSFFMEILLYLIIWILQMIKYRDEQLEQTIYDCANLFHLLMLTFTLLFFNGYFLPGLFLISIISIIILIKKIIQNFLD
jgi:hypothetical protein